jgi:hypothetical protein
LKASGVEVPEEWELISFFETHPALVDQHERKFFGRLDFVRDVGGGDVLRWSVSKLGDMRITLARDEVERVVLVARKVVRVTIERLHGVETLVALVARPPDLDRVRLTLRPTFRLEWGLEE